MKLIFCIPFWCHDYCLLFKISVPLNRTTRAFVGVPFFFDLFSFFFGTTIPAGPIPGNRDLGALLICEKIAMWVMIFKVTHFIGLRKSDTRFKLTIPVKSPYKSSTQNGWLLLESNFLTQLIRLILRFHWTQVSPILSIDRTPATMAIWFFLIVNRNFVFKKHKPKLFTLLFP